MRYDPYRRIDGIGWPGVVRLLAVLFVVSVVLAAGLVASVRLGLVDRDMISRDRGVDWRELQDGGGAGD